MSQWFSFLKYTEFHILCSKIGTQRLIDILNIQYSRLHVGKLAPRFSHVIHTMFNISLGKFEQRCSCVIHRKWMALFQICYIENSIFHMGILALIFSHMKHKDFFLYKHLGWDFLILNVKNLIWHVWKSVHRFLFVKCRDVLIHEGKSVPWFL